MTIPDPADVGILALRHWASDRAAEGCSFFSWRPISPEGPHQWCRVEPRHFCGEYLELMALSHSIDFAVCIVESPD